MTALSEIAPGLWAAHADLWMQGVYFPIRMTVIDIDGALLVHSPVPPTDALVAEVAALGEVRWLVAPCLLHHLSLPGWAARFPDAELWGPPGIEKKQPSLAFTGAPDGALPAAWSPALSVHWVKGAPKVDEFAFLHTPSRTLVVTDLLFNFKDTRGLLSKLVFTMARVLGGPAQSRLWRFFTKDRAAAGESVRALLALDFDRLVMAHGDVVETGGKAVLETACAWMLEGAAP